ncbi:MAG: hypothetical protein IJY87_01995 [Bacilli bacterium]|nr:hypothetical protein [Bacilli bacterium]
MQTYGDIIERIKEIIALSEQRKTEISVIELNENYNNYFVSKLWYEIAVEYAKEFEELLDAERTFYLLKNAKDFDVLNRFNSALKVVCQNRGSEENELTEDYLTLLGILNNADGRTAFELTEYKGYFIVKEELTSFIAICRKLKVGPYKSLKESTKGEVTDFVYSEMDRKKSQRNRINDYIISSYTKEINPAIDNPITKANETEYTLFTTIDEKPKDALFDRKPTKTYYRELIYLGIIGKLSIDMVVELKNIMTTGDFELLLDDLQKWQIFDEKEFLKIKNKAYSNQTNIEDIDQLVGFFVTKENLNAKALESLIPAIGIENFDYMMDKLFKYGAIEVEDYLQYIERRCNVNFQKK